MSNTKPFDRTGMEASTGGLDGGAADPPHAVATLGLHPTRFVQDPSPPTVSGAAARGPLGNQQLRHFRVDRLIAEGGMGAVYRGFDTALGRPVAIKIIRPELAVDPRYLQVFLREAQAQANVVHSHVLQAYYVGEERGTWFLAMQLVEGGSLEDRLVAGARLTWKEAARHMSAVVEGMAEAARFGIVHRDIKPANILLDRFGEAHVADFGLASSTGFLPTLGKPASGMGTRRAGSTSPGAVNGTPEYMAPEQLLGRPVDERADIYAIGGTFYQLITGKLPYPITDIESCGRAFRGPPHPPLRKLQPEVPRGFAELIDRCLARDPDQRPATHAQLLVELRRVGPRPEVTPSPVARALSMVLDLLPFAALLPLTYLKLPGLAFAVMFAALALGLGTLSATPGQWMMRLWLRGAGGGDVPLWRLWGRSLLQLGWLLPGSLFLTLAYADSEAATPTGVLGAGWAGVSLLGSLLALGGSRQALHDRLTGTRVLVATD